MAKRLLILIVNPGVGNSYNMSLEYDQDGYVTHGIFNHDASFIEYHEIEKQLPAIRNFIFHKHLYYR